MISIIAGAYDGTLHGWQGGVDDLKLVFAFKAHDSCIKALDVCGSIACSAASDESIQLYDLAKKRVMDRMSGVHEDEVTAVAFATNKDGEVYLISGDLKGKLYAWDTAKCKVIHELKGHKQNSAVTSIAVHPSGRVALSTARDNSLRMWDLVNAKAAPRIKLDDFKTLSCSCWSPDNGNRYAVVGDETSVVIFDALSSSEKPLGLNKHPRRINAVKFIQDIILVTACDDGILRIIGADGNEIRFIKPTNKCRLRDVATLPVKDENVDGALFVAGAYSDGSIKVWDINDDDDEPCADLNMGTAAHVTSVCIGWTDVDDAPKVSVERSSTKKAKTMRN